MKFLMKRYFEFTFAAAEKQKLVDIGLTFKSNPYQDYLGFKKEVQNCIVQNNLYELPGFLEIKKYREKSEKNKLLPLHLKNCPIDLTVPIFDFSRPLEDKWDNKKTFVGEFFLLLLSIIFDLPILAYTTRNKGDFYQDVYAQSAYSGTQTQKSDSELYFHNDRTAHYIRADYLCLLCMRSQRENIIKTKYIDGNDLLKAIPQKYHNVLRENIFFEPLMKFQKIRIRNKENLFCILYFQIKVFFDIMILVLHLSVIMHMLLKHYGH